MSENNADGLALWCPNCAAYPNPQTAPEVMDGCCPRCWTKFGRAIPMRTDADPVCKLCNQTATIPCADTDAASGCRRYNS